MAENHLDSDLPDTFEIQADTFQTQADPESRRVSQGHPFRIRDTIITFSWLSRKRDVVLRIWNESRAQSIAAASEPQRL